jgi:MFS family permease
MGNSIPMDAVVQQSFYDFLNAIFEDDSWKSISSKPKESTTDIEEAPLEPTAVKSEELYQDATAADNTPTAQGANTASFPDGGLRAWLTVFGSFCCLFCSFGWINAMGVFQEYYQSVLFPNYSTSAISWIVSLEAFMIFIGGVIYGKLYDNFGPRHLILGGTFFHVFGLLMTSFSTQYYQILLSQGICSPLGASAVLYPALSSTSSWFYRHRALALGIVATGASFGGIIWPIFVQNLIPRIGFPWAMRATALFNLLMMLFANLTVRSRLPPSPSPLTAIEFLLPFTELPFLLLTIASFLICLGLWLPLTFIIPQALAAGVDSTLAKYALPLLNLASVFGRTLPGWAADKLGRFNVMFVMNLLSAFLVLALWIPSTAHPAAVVAFAALYGFSSGTYVGLISALIAQISDIRAIGIRNGTLYASVSVAALVGSPIGGSLIGQDGRGFVAMQIWAGLILFAGSVVMGAARWSLVGWELRAKV